MLIIKSIEAIKSGLLVHQQPVRNFPRALNFPFSKLYVQLTTQIKTTEISSECILFDSVQAFNETKIYSDPDYWNESCTTDEIAKYWMFGQNGQGDLWLFDIENKVYFYDHNRAQMCKENFAELDLNFEQWLQFADLNKQLDDVYETQDEISAEIEMEYKAKLSELNNVLLKNYPFDI